VAPEATGPAEEKKAANLKKPDGTKSEGTVKEKISETAATAKGEATDTAYIPKEAPSPLRSFVESRPDSDDIYTDNEIFIPIHGFVNFTEEEMSIINHPAFQRLGEIYQLGQSHLVFRGATHKRLEHVLGAVHVVQEIIDAVAHNHDRLQRLHPSGQGSPLCSAITKKERVFTRLGALLHDIGHLPAGHTLEDELKLIPKHDAVARLNLVLDRSDWPGSTSPPLRQVINTRYSQYLTNSSITPVELLFEIIAKDPANSPNIPSDVRVPICRDIVGNTICADLLDYLHRDWYHVGKPKYYEKRLFQYMEIRKDSDGQPRFVISLGEKSRLKTDAISAILDLLECRYQLAEAVLFHRTKCSAAAMLERAIQELAESRPAKERRQWTDGLEKRLLDYSDTGLLKTLLAESEGRNCHAATRCLSSLRNRRIYKTIYTTYHSDRLASVPKRLQQIYSTGESAPANRLAAVRLLEENFNLPPGSVAVYCPSRGMNAKIAEVRIHMDGVIDMFKEWDRDEVTLGGGHLSAQIVRFTRLWRVHVSLDREAWSAMSDPIRHLFYRAAKELILGINDFPPEKAAYDLALAASVTPGSPYFSLPVHDRDKAARRDQPASYPSGAPSLRAFFDLSK
jgi:HD superfamily phosphohydrolase